uniref:Uncharacterized protein n=1 Tax=Arachis hypogaea TaxID=3818 RepID=G0Y6U5_ARAHY|nr:hypothetical protein 303L13_15 [Arachis hypogaea]
MEEEGGSCPRRATMRGERVAPHHRQPGARRSCPIALPPAASSSLQLRRHQRPEPREVRPRGGTSAREETRKKYYRRSASPPSNCYSRRALSSSPLSFNRRHLCWGSPSLLNEEGEFESASEGRKKESRWRVECKIPTIPLVPLFFKPNPNPLLTHSLTSHYHTHSHSPHSTHTQTLTEKRKKEKGKREKGRLREENGGGRRELSTPSHHARRESRTSSPPAWSTPFVSRRVAASRVQLVTVASPSEARTERGASERRDECERGDAEEGLPPFCLAAVELPQPPCLVFVAAKLQLPPSLLGVTVIAE